MKSSGRLIVAIFLAVVLAGAFWLYGLSPKREEAKKLDAQLEALRSSITQSQGELLTAREARREFPQDYSQMIQLGKAVPRGDDTSSLLIALNGKADKANIVFDSLLSVEAGDAAATEATIATASVPGAEVPPTEAAAALLPIGASIGPAGLGVMPYNLKFTGKFLEVTKFLSEIDAFVSTDENLVAVDGRLVTINGFSLTADQELGFPVLSANLSVTSYVTPPNQGVTLGASPTAPAVPSAPGAAPVETPAPSATPAPLAAASGAK